MKAEPYNGSDYLEAFQSVADVEIERPARAMYGELSAREATIENGMRVARALRSAPDAVEYLFRIQQKQCSEEAVMKIDLLEPERRTYYQSSWHAVTPASLSELATKEGLERFRDHRRRFMEAAKLAVEPADADRIASLEHLESRLEAVQPVKLVPGQIACQLGSSWVPASVIRDFALETFQIGYGDASRERGSTRPPPRRAASRSATPRCPAGGASRPPAAAWTSRSRRSRAWAPTTAS